MQVLSNKTLKFLRENPEIVKIMSQLVDDKLESMEVTLKSGKKIIVKKVW
jgi:hypothetical protein